LTAVRPVAESSTHQNIPLGKNGNIATAIAGELRPGSVGLVTHSARWDVNFRVLENANPERDLADYAGLLTKLIRPVIYGDEGIGRAWECKDCAGIITVIPIDKAVSLRALAILLLHNNEQVVTVGIPVACFVSRERYLPRTCRCGETDQGEKSNDVDPQSWT
jgi:hypothetical protein